MPKVLNNQIKFGNISETNERILQSILFDFENLDVQTSPCLLTFETRTYLTQGKMYVKGTVYLILNVNLSCYYGYFDSLLNFNKKFI